MPLLDHFHPPLSLERPWEGVHSAWASVIAEHLNESQLPERYVAMPHVRRGTAIEVEIGIPDRDLFEVRITQAAGEPRLIAAIELVSPANKDRFAYRQAFAGKCAGYLRQGIGLIVVDVVTDRHDSLQRAIEELLELDAAGPPHSRLFAAAYRTAPKTETLQLEIWSEALSVGLPLPTLPLWLERDLAVPVDFEATYALTCRRLRIQPASGSPG